MNGTRLVFVILKYRLRSLGRFVAANAFAIFVLGPLVLGGSLWVVERYLHLLRGALAALVAGEDPPGAVGLGLALLATALSLPSTQRELFARSTGSGYLDALPVPEPARFHVALAACWSRQLPVCGVLLVALAALREGGVGPATLGGWAWQLLAAFVPLVLLAMAATQVRVRLGPLRLGGWRLLLGLGAVLAALGLLAPAGRAYLLLPWWTSAARLSAVLAEALAVPAPVTGAAGTGVALAVTVLVLYLAAGGLFLGYRRRDLERAESLAWKPRSARGGRMLPRLAAVLHRLPLAGRPAMWTQVGRDLLLVGRRFSPAVYLAAALALLTQAVVVAVLPQLSLGEVGLRRLAVMGSVAAVLCVAALVPLLLKHQLPRLWLEKSTAVPLEEVWRAKLWLARILALPAAALGAVVLWTLPGAGFGTSLLQLAAAAWIVASVIGFEVFEIAAQPLIGLTFGSLVGLALAALFVFYPAAWWLWGAFYLVLASKLGERATRRVRFTEVEP